jgi:hypothetical protein
MISERTPKDDLLNIVNGLPLSRSFPGSRERLMCDSTQDLLIDIIMSEYEKNS